MGRMTPVKALWVALIASPILAVLSLLPWTRTSTYFVGSFSQGVPGTQINNIASFGDGTLILLGAMATFAMAAWGLHMPDARRAAGLGLAATGFAMFGIALYDSVNVGGVDGNGWTTIGYGSEVRLTVVPYFVAATALLVGLAGMLALILQDEKAADRSDDSEREGIRQRTISIGITTHRALQVIMWAAMALAVLAFVPWLDAHSVRVLTADRPVVMTALGDAVLMSSLALTCAFLAPQMMRDPSEIVWAGLVVAGGALFVMAGSEITESMQGCASNGTILGFLNTNILGGCYRDGGYSLSAGTAIGWVAVSVSTLVALLGLALPIIEAVGRNNNKPERAKQW